MMPFDRCLPVSFVPVFRRASARGALALFALAFFAARAPLAHADVVLAFAEGPVTVIRGSSLYRTGEGAQLRDDDIIETDAGGSAQLEDGAGTVIALGPQTRVLLKTPSVPREPAARSVRISVLSGWLKASRAVGSVQQPSPSIDIHGIVVKPASDGRWSVVAMGSAQRAEFFAESGNDAIVPGRVPPQAPQQILRAGQYLERLSDDPLRVQPRPSAEFITAMPLGFRDPLIGVSGRLGSTHELPAAERAVDYADVFDWLMSNVSERGTFVKRFAGRLKSAEFRSQVDAHLNALPEWRPVLHPSPHPLTETHKRPAQALPTPRREPNANIEYRDKPTSDDTDAH